MSDNVPDFKVRLSLYSAVRNKQPHAGLHQSPRYTLYLLLVEGSSKNFPDGVMLLSVRCFRVSDYPANVL